MQLTEQDIADYLLATPDFFDRHAELVSQIQLISPHGKRAVSLQERQMELQRDKTRALEIKMSEMVRYAQENDAIQTKLAKWVNALLAETETRVLPDILTRELSAQFNLPQVAVRLWNLQPLFADIPAAQGFSDDVVSFAHSLTLPYCGANTGFEAARWMGDAGEVHSIALIALRAPGREKAFGMLALGSADPQRFRTGMGTEFLWRIGEISSAALARLTA
jgi:uncharacterized protein